MTAETVTLNRNGLLTPDRMKSLILPGAFLGLIAIATIISPSFLSVSNLQDVLTQAAPLMIVVIGQTFVILVRGLDLSVASLMATVAVIATAFDTQDDAMIPVIFVSAILFCVVVGFINGWLVTKRNVSPFLATLAMMIVLQGCGSITPRALPQGFCRKVFASLAPDKSWEFLSTSSASQSCLLCFPLS